MTKAKKLRRKVGMVLSLACVILAFFPSIRLEDESTQTFMQLMKNEEFMNLPAGMGKIIIVVLLISVITHVCDFIIWYCKKDKSDLGYMAFNLITLGAMMIFPIIFTFTDVGILSSFPWSGWMILRMCIWMIDIINKSAGEQFIEAFSNPAT